MSLDIWSLYSRHVSTAHAQLKLLGTCTHMMLRRDYGGELERHVEAAKRECDAADLVLFDNYVAEAKYLKPVRPDLDAMLSAIAEDLTRAGCFDTARHAQHLRQVLKQELELKAAAAESRRAA